MPEVSGVYITVHVFSVPDDNGDGSWTVLMEFTPGLSAHAVKALLSATAEGIDDSDSRFSESVGGIQATASAPGSNPRGLRKVLVVLRHGLGRLYGRGRNLLRRPGARGLPQAEDGEGK